MKELLLKIATCVEAGKINKEAPYPPAMRGQEGTEELTCRALEAGIPAAEVLRKGLLAGMDKVSVKFREKKAYLPQVLLSAKAMNKAMIHLKPYFKSGEVVAKGTFIIGTVEGDNHDLGKNLVAMIVEGNGWNVVDLGVNVTAGQFIEALEEHEEAIVGLSAFLSSSLVSMEKILKAVKEAKPGVKVVVGGASVTEDFSRQIGADSYSHDPQGLVQYLESLSGSQGA